jgi:hypothetical protein
VAENYLDIRKLVEQLAAHQTQRVDRSLDREPPRRSREPCVPFVLA